MRVADAAVSQDANKDKRPKSMISESHVKERKGNANKQFSYNKLVNEGRGKSNQVKASKQKPQRPPQPRNEHQEGLLIDLSPVDANEAAISATSAAQRRNNATGLCLLDEPIDVPTEEMDALDVFQDAVVGEPRESSPVVFRCPPPYQQPPQYSNLFEGNLSSPQGSPQKPVASKNPVVYSNSLQANEMLKNLNRQMYASVNAMAKNNNSASVSPRPDPIGAEMLLYQGSPNYSRVPAAAYPTPAAVTNGLSASFGQLSVAQGAETESQTQSVGGAIPKKALDRNFIAELEKYVSYKDQAALQVNSVQALANKEVSPKKNFSDNRQTEMMDRIYGNSSSSSNQSTYANGGENATTALIQQMWQESTLAQKNNMTTQQVSEIYSNNNNTNRPVATTHNFVAVSNRPVSMAALPATASPSTSHQQQQQQQQLHQNHYNSVYGESYYSTAAAGSVHYETCPTQAVYSNAQQQQILQQPQAYAVYDEVAEEQLLQPTRPAPTVPVLSAQQIQRRMQGNIYNDVASIYGDTASIYGDVSTGSIYGDVIENQKITAFCVEVGPEASVIDARQALTATNWDHRLAVRHFKVGQLMKLGLGTWETCEGALAKSGWSVEVAASILLEK